MKKSTLLLICTLFASGAWAQQMQKTAQGLKAQVNQMEVEIRFISPKIVQVTKIPQGLQDSKTSLSVIKKPEKTNITATESDGVMTISTDNLQIRYDSQTGKISFYSPQSRLLFTEKDHGAQFTHFNNAGDSTFSPRQAFLLAPDEAIYGLGQTQTKSMNQRNQKLYMRQRQHEGGYAFVPIIQSTKGYGIFWDNYSPTHFIDNPQELSFESEIGDRIDYYFMYGGNADGVIAQIRELTGQAPMYPLWSFGFFQSRERYKSQNETMEVVDKYRALGIPLDCIIQDWQYWGPDSNWNAMRFDNPNFPQPQKMIDHVHAQNAKIMISVWQSFGKDTEQFKKLKDMNALLEFTTWPLAGGVRVHDVYNPASRKLYTDYLHKGLMTKGIDAWWTDSTEPDHLNLKEEDFNIPTAMGTYRSVVNAYPLLANQMIYDKQRSFTSDKRALLLTRSAFAGQQRYATNVWSGDLRSTWDVLKKQVPTGLNFSLTGIPYWNTDIGGFFLWDYEGGTKNKAYLELYTRWFQYATFTPMQRSHGSGVAKEIYNLGKKGDWVYDSEEKYIHLRYALLPYIYSTSWQVTDKGSSMLRALYMDFAQDTKTFEIGNQYMFGPSILVNPVTDPMYVSGTGDNWKNPKEDFSQTKTQAVYLPAGSAWFDFWTGEKLAGGTTVEREAPIDIIPLYIREGAILPFGPKVHYATEKRWDNLELRIYPGADGSFILYEDENDNYNYEKGAHSQITFTWNDAKKQLQISAPLGQFDGMLQKRKFNIVLVDPSNGVGSEQATKFTKSITYNGKALQVKL